MSSSHISTYSRQDNRGGHAVVCLTIFFFTPLPRPCFSQVGGQGSEICPDKRKIHGRSELGRQVLVLQVQRAKGIPLHQVLRANGLGGAEEAISVEGGLVLVFRTVCGDVEAGRDVGYRRRGQSLRTTSICPLLVEK